MTIIYYYTGNLLFQTALAILLISLICRHNPDDHRSVIFQRLMYAGLTWAGFDLIMTLNQIFLPGEDAFRMYGVLSIMFLLFPPMAIQLSFSLIRELSRREKNLILAPYVMLYLIILLFPQFGSAATFGIPGGFSGGLPPWNTAFKVLSLAAPLASVMVLLIHASRETERVVKKEKQLLALGGILFMLGLALSQVLKNTLPGLPWFANLSSTLFSFSAFLSLKKYGRVLSGQTLFETTVKISPFGISHIRDMRMIWTNSSMQQLLNRDAGSIADIREIFHNDQPDGITRDDIIKGINAGNLQSRMVYVTNGAGQAQACLINCAPLEKNRPENGVLMILTDVSEENRIRSELVDLNRQLEKMAHIDGLTGIANRRQFDRVLEKEWHRACRNRHPLSLVLFDVDFFKRFNDLYGHPTGDICLKQVAAEIRKSASRPGDLAARFGGEEFSLILPETDSRGAAQIADRIRERIRTLHIPHKDSDVAGVVTISSGIVSAAEFDALSPAELVRRADEALYRAKALGRDRTEIFTSL
ncbi:MAG TPA: hypothetical protein DHV36_05780 [Desulfobacteraceae bacterium]|nr:hypothetical protein [Desulfobacteraceae bacterium]